MEHISYLLTEDVIYLIHKGGGNFFMNILEGNMFRM